MRLGGKNNNNIMKTTCNVENHTNFDFDPKLEKNHFAILVEIAFSSCFEFNCYYEPNSFCAFKIRFVFF